MPGQKFEAVTFGSDWSGRFGVELAWVEEQVESFVAGWTVG